MQLQKEKAALTDSQTGKIRIKIQNTAQLTGQPSSSFNPPLYPQNQPPIYVQNQPVYVQNQPTFMPGQSYSQVQNQPQYVQYPHPQSQVVPQGHYLQQQFLHYSQPGPYPAGSTMQPQTIMRPMNAPPFNPLTGQFRPY